MNTRLIDKCNAAEALDQLADFNDSLLWAIIREHIEDANRKQIHDIGQDPNMPNKELHFRRGTIFANDSLFNLLATIQNQLEGRLALETATKSEGK